MKRALKSNAAQEPDRRRADGSSTRELILEAAGQVFAQKGFAAATGKEIAERAGANSAAVNYYYGGIEALYGEVLVEAHHRIVQYEALEQIAKAKGEARTRLRRMLTLVARAVLTQAETSWPLRVLSREILSPSPALEILQDREILPKKGIIAQVVGEILGQPPTSPLVDRCCLNIVSPFLLLLIANRGMLTAAFPGMLGPGAQVEEVVEHVVTYALGGLAAVGKSLKRR